MGSRDDYEQINLIGVGGFAEVYLALHVPTQRTRALKVSRSDAESLARIRREIEVQRRLNHANVMPIIDWDTEEFTWFATEVAEGNLGAIHERTPLGEDEIVRFVEEILAGLGAAHRRGFVHRDLSPGNILRTGGRWVLADWGYVSDQGASGALRLTRTGTGGGTFVWAAPEALQDAHRVDGRSDLYALGKLTAWLLNGKVTGIGAAPELPEPGPWRRLLIRLTEQDPAERFQSAEEALTGLSEVASTVAPCAGEPTTDKASSVADSVSASVSALKRYLVAPEHRIRLFDMITSVTASTVARVSDDRFSPQQFDRGELLLQRLQAYFEACRPLMHLIFVGCYFGNRDQEDHWHSAVQRLIDAPKATAGVMSMIDLQRVPASLVMSAGAFGAILGKQYQNVSAVALRPILRLDNGSTLPMVARMSPASVFDRDLLRTIKRFDRAKTPGSQLLFEYLREMGRSVLVSDSEYEEQFDRFEVLIGLLTIDRGGWYVGCFAWRDHMSALYPGNGPLGRVRREFEAQGAKWEPLVAGLFDGDPDRVNTAFDTLTRYAHNIAMM